MDRADSICVPGLLNRNSVLGLVCEMMISDRLCTARDARVLHMLRLPEVYRIESVVVIIESLNTGS